MSSRKEAILAAALPVLPILVRYLQLAIEELAMHTFLTPYRYHWGCILCLFHCKFDSKLTGKYISAFLFTVCSCMVAGYQRTVLFTSFYSWWVCGLVMIRPLSLQPLR